MSTFEGHTMHDPVPVKAAVAPLPPGHPPFKKAGRKIKSKPIPSTFA